MIYVMHIHHQHCDGCGASETQSRLYSAEEAQRGSRYLPCHSVGPLDPIRKLELAPVHIPVCAACVDEDRANLGADIHVKWQETLKRKAQQAMAAPSGAARTKAEPSLDDLA